MRRFLGLALLLVPSWAQPIISHGPYWGHVGPTEAFLWLRTRDFRGPIKLVLTAGATEHVVLGTSKESADGCTTFEVTGLPFDTVISARFEAAGRVLEHPPCTIRTPPPHDRLRETRLAFGSCAHHLHFPDQPVWTRMRASGPEAVVLLGDTPYVDSVQLERQHARYRGLYAVETLVPLLRTVPLYATWDDHDFGANDTDGRLPDKLWSRRAFLHYHAHPPYGEREEGIYTTFRRGSIQVFLLDTRWFANTAPSFADVKKPTLLGSAQWAWLQRELKASTAPFKILASGIVWNGAVRPGKRDHWASWPHEQRALFQFIGREDISGVVLLGGDIHRSRAIRHATKETAGYDLLELITSPLASHVIPLANVPHPGLLHDSGENHTFLLLTADTRKTPSTLEAQFLTADGRQVFRTALGNHELHR